MNWLKILIGIVLFLSFHSGRTTHIRGGYILVRPVSGAGLTFDITVYGIRDIGSDIKFGGNGVLSFGDGNTTAGDFSAYEIERTVINQEVELVAFSYQYTYSQPNASGYVVSYKEDFRNYSIKNIPDSENISFYTQTRFVVDPVLSPPASLYVEPFHDLVATLGTTFHTALHLQSVHDVDFWLVKPEQGPEIPIAGYQFPNHQDFYDVDHDVQEPRFEMDRLSGTLTWDVPYEVGYLFGQHQGEFNFAYICRQKQLFEGNEVVLQVIRVDQQIIAEPLDLTTLPLPDFQYPDFICSENDVADFNVTIDGEEDQAFSLNLFGDLPDSVNGVSMEAENSISGVGDTVLRFHSYLQPDDLRLHRVSFQLKSGNAPTQSFATVYANNCEANILKSEKLAGHDLHPIIFPNPGTGDYKIVLEDNWIAYLRVISLTGSIVLEENLDKGINSINLHETIKPGIYMIQFFDEADRLISSDRLVKVN